MVIKTVCGIGELRWPNQDSVFKHKIELDWRIVSRLPRILRLLYKKAKGMGRIMFP